MTKMQSMITQKERYRAKSIRKFPDSLSERLWNVKVATNNQVTLEDLIVRAIEFGLPKIEHRVLFRVPDFVEEPSDNLD